ncbi:MAG TPA: Tex family protein [Polyangiaceae bacterium]|nr:Tex family protein [Polyangiaceae bacterium]
MEIVERVSRDVGVAGRAVEAVVRLLGEGSTVPFVARYRKEATGGLDEVQIRAIVERHGYLVELEARRESVIEEIARQGKLDAELEKRLRQATSKAELEDLYAPYRPKRRTRAALAKERGLEALALKILAQAPTGDPRAEARAFVDPEKGVPDVEAALAGARDICAEQIADDAAMRARVREALVARGVIASKKVKDKRGERTKFDDYDDYSESVRRLASHRYLAICRGENEGVLRVAVRVEDEARLLASIKVSPRSPWREALQQAAEDALTRLLMPRAVAELRSTLKENADRDAVDIFAKNLRQLLLSPPYGEKAVLGIDPGQRTGCKCAVVDATGKLLAHDTIYLVQGDKKLADARATLVALVQKYDVTAVAVGNGTHGRETEAFARQTVSVLVVSVNEAGASVYSASDMARAELPDIDVSVRGAVSIARRLQDPLAELVKIDPKSIGVGQYQHDVHQPLLAAKLDETVEDCVHSVGVELNTTSAPLLARVVGPKLAQQVVTHRDRHGAFRRRDDLLEVRGFGPKTFEQAAGFLRIRAGRHPLDASAVHPERYALVERMARDLGLEDLKSLIGNSEALTKLDRRRYLTDDVGSFTFDDIVAELVKPGRDPRSSFEPPRFRDDVRTLEDLKADMELEGVVTNVTDFGAFVDVGVKQDGLVHISQLADRFVKHPSEVVGVGDKIKVRVLSVDRERGRISLSARRDVNAPRPRGGA